MYPVEVVEDSKVHIRKSIKAARILVVELDVCMLVGRENSAVL